MTYFNVYFYADLIFTASAASFPFIEERNFPLNISF